MTMDKENGGGRGAASIRGGGVARRRTGTRNTTSNSKATPDDASLLRLSSSSAAPLLAFDNVTCTTTHDATTTTTTTTTTTPTEAKGLNQLRRSLRATLLPHQPKLTPMLPPSTDTTSPLTSPTELNDDLDPENSPNWARLLQKELDNMEDEQIDHSLLFSPAPVVQHSKPADKMIPQPNKVAQAQPSNSRKVTKPHSFNDTRQHHTIIAAANKMDSRPTTSRLLLPIGQPRPNKLGPPQRLIPFERAGAAEEEEGAPTLVVGTTNPPPSTKKKVRFAPQENANRREGLPKEQVVVLGAPTEAFNQASRSSHSPDSMTIARGANLTEKQQSACQALVPSSIASKNTSWSQVMPSVLRAPLSPPSPFTPGKSGICMDLTNMFPIASPPTTTPMTFRTSSKRTCTERSARTATVVKSIRVNSTPSHLAATNSSSSDTDDWADKQCEFFKNWLNFTLLPQEEQEHGLDNVEAGNADSRAALRILKIHQSLGEARYKSLGVYTGGEMKAIRNAIDSEIGRGRLSIRPEFNLYADVTLRKQLLHLLLSYSTPWLRLGLETMFGEAIESVPVQQRNDGIPIASTQAKGVIRRPSLETQQPSTTMAGLKLALKNFIISRVLSDKAVLATYGKGRAKVPSGKFGVQYEAEMRKLVLRRLLTLFFFLDRLKSANLLEKYPCLFVHHSEVKSTKDVLIAFCRDFLSAEGNIIKHLSRVGLKAIYQQDVLEELDFTVDNMAVDLRDGVRLGRMTEIISNAPKKTILAMLRLPAVSRLQKLHNVGLVLDALRGVGVPLSRDIAAYHVVDGHREIVLKIMWSVVFELCLKDILDIQQVEAEIERIQRINKTRMKVNVKVDGCESANNSGMVTMREALRLALLRWSASICSIYGIAIRDIVRDFADGKAFCYLIHYYHPTILRLGEIKTTTNDLSSDATSSDLDQCLANERFNSSLANARMTDLGGMPKMVPVCDTCSLPEAKSMLMCLSFMCSRLMESNREVRSSAIIQHYYRRYRAVMDMRQKKVAARVIFQKWHIHRSAYYETRKRKYGKAVEAIERFILGRRRSLERMKEERVFNLKRKMSAVLIQVRFIRGIIGGRLDLFLTDSRWHRRHMHGGCYPSDDTVISIRLRRPLSCCRVVGVESVRSASI